MLLPLWLPILKEWEHPRFLERKNKTGHWVQKSLPIFFNKVHIWHDTECVKDTQ